jgi:predicted GNAT family N-acyltransferase
MGVRGQGGQHELTVRHIELQDKTGALSLGEAEFAPLKAFLRNEAKRPSVEFYLKYGFTPIQESHEDQGSPVLFLDLHPHV